MKVKDLIVRGMIFIGFIFAMSSSLVLVTGCAMCSHESRNMTVADIQPHVAQLSQEQVINIAKVAAEHEGYRLTDYKDPEAHFEYTRKDKSWVVFFDGKTPRPGNHFSVDVVDQTGYTQVMPGE